jgi:hypothetical protein
VLLVADFEYRVRFIMKKYRMSQSEAEAAVKRADMIRTRFLNCFSDTTSHDDPLLYTVTLNMNEIGMEKAEALVVQLVS